MNIIYLIKVEKGGGGGRSKTLILKKWIIYWFLFLSLTLLDHCLDYWLDLLDHRLDRLDRQPIWSTKQMRQKTFMTLTSTLMSTLTLLLTLAFTLTLTLIIASIIALTFALTLPLTTLTPTHLQWTLFTLVSSSYTLWSNSLLKSNKTKLWPVWSLFWIFISIFVSLKPFLKTFPDFSWLFPTFPDFFPTVPDCSRLFPTVPDFSRLFLTFLNISHLSHLSYLSYFKI